MIQHPLFGRATITELDLDDADSPYGIGQHTWRMKHEVCCQNVTAEPLAIYGMRFVDAYSAR